VPGLAAHLLAVEHHLVSRDDQGDSTISKVVVHHGEQYPSWSEDRENPCGYGDVGTHGTEADCLASSKKVWTDMRSLSLRQTMADA